MNEKLKDSLLLYAKTRDFKKKVYESKGIIYAALKKYKKPYVAYSGGKDSTCVLHLVISINPNIMVLHWDYGKYFIPREIHNEIINNAKLIGAKNIRIETSKKYEILKRNAQNVLGQDLIGKLIPKLKKEGYDCTFVGLRAQESVKRRLRIKKGRILTKIPEIFPVQNWTWMDVWSYIISNRVPYLKHYDTYGEVIGYDKVRFTTLFDEEFAKFGSPQIDSFLSWKYKNLL